MALIECVIARSGEAVNVGFDFLDKDAVQGLCSVVRMARKLLHRIEHEVDV